MEDWHHVPVEPAAQQNTPVLSGGRPAERALTLIGALRSRPTLLAALVLAVLSVAIWGRTVANLGLYYDDWALLAQFDDARSKSPVDLWNACRDFEPNGRPGGCVYHPLAYLVTGAKVRGYHLLSLFYIWISSLVLLVLLRQCRMSWALALGVAALWIVYPGSDSTRLWPTAAGAQLILTLYMVAVLLGIAALRRTGWRSIAFHAAAVVIFTGLVLTYEIVIPLIAVTGVLYWLALPGRAALVHGAVDFAVAVAFYVFRTWITPVSADSNIVVERKAGEIPGRVLDLLNGTWQSWQDLFAPGSAGAGVAILGAGTVAVALFGFRESRRRILLWLALALLGVAAAGVAVVAYLPANDLYVPRPDTLFNRLNVSAAPAYCLIFVALLGALFTSIRAIAGRVAAVAIVAALVGAVVSWQLEMGSRSQAAWQEAWNQETRAAAGIGGALAHAPPDASVVSFGHPLWERGFIPVFTSSWDLRGMIDYQLAVDPPRAVPFLPTVSCSRDGVLVDNALYIRFRDSSPVWFANATTGEGRQVESLKACQKAVADWGIPPYWGASVTGG
jgi:hypothetical protein